MKQQLITLLAAATLTTGLANAKVFTGTVYSSVDNEPLIGATVAVKGTGVGVSTDVDGEFSIDVPENAKTLVVRYVGMEPIEVSVKSLKKQGNEFRLEETKTALNEVVVTGMGARKKITVTGAVTNVNVDDMKHFSTSNLSNTLAGNVPGVFARQTSGQPGRNKSEFWIRGISTFGAGASAYILVDGFERENIDDLNIEDIETFTVLKDASATAIYGSKGANGVVLITTKHGKAGAVKVNAKFETSYNTRTKTPDFVDGLTYARMLNEGNITRSKGEYFNPQELALIQNGLDPDIYPNVNWKDLILKDGAMSYRAMANISGGGSTARYYASISYVNDEGMYKTDETLRNKYNTNANYSRWNYRLNLDIDLTPTTVLRLGTSGDLSTRNSPGIDDNRTWNSLFAYNAITCPVLYSNGYVPKTNLKRGDDRDLNPWVQATQTGYYQEWNNNLQNNVTLEQDLRFVTPGLRFTGRFGYDTYNFNRINHFQTPESYYHQGRDKDTGEIIFDKTHDRKDMEQSSNNDGSRRIFADLLLSYNRSFGEHNVGANLKFTYDDNISTQNIGSDIKNSVAHKNMALAGQVSYNWKYRYFIDVNFGYNGSENFADGHRFGFFPAASAAWNLTREDFMKDVKWLDMFKIRYSYGKVGNDNLYIGNDRIRFPYLYNIDYIWRKVDDKDVLDTRGYNFGTMNDPTREEYRKMMHFTALASNNVTWEEATKQDVGLDIALFNNCFSLTVDYFHEKREGIFMTRNFLPYSLGLEQSPNANVGKVTSKGVDGHFRFEKTFGEFALTVRGNMTYSKNTVDNYDVENNVYPYQNWLGHRVNQIRGLVAEGLFNSYEEIRNHPKQMFGDVQPGDIKYKDVNGDGVVDDGDICAIGATTRPNLVYGVGVSLAWRGLDFNVHFQGAGKASTIIQGKTVWAFSEGRWGQILTDLVEDRWVDSETAAKLGIAANENPNAAYPRMPDSDGTLGRGNNYRASSFWLRDISYVRLKNLEVGYNFPKSWVNAIHFENIRLFVQGANLLTWSSFKLWDPEMGSNNGEAYPLSKSITAGFQINI